MLPNEIIDNSPKNKLLDFIKNSLQENKNPNFDIATAFFDIQAFGLIKDELKGVKRFRLLLGKVPEMRTKSTLGEVLKNDLIEEIKEMGLSKQNDNVAYTFINFLKSDQVEIRLFEDDFLHGKTYIFDDKAVLESSNFTVFIYAYW